MSICKLFTGFVNDYIFLPCPDLFSICLFFYGQIKVQSYASLLTSNTLLTIDSHAYSTYT